MSLPRAFVFNFERLDISWAKIIHLSQKLWPFEFAESFNLQIWDYRYIIRMNWKSESKVMAVWICLTLPCLISSGSIYYAPESDIQEKGYDRLNFQTAAIVQFWASRYIMGLNHIPKSKVMTIWICRQLCYSNLRVSIYYWPEYYIRFKSYGRLNLPCASMFNFECLDILCAWTGHPREKLRPFEFLETFHCSIPTVSIYHGPQSYIWVKRYDRLSFPRAFMFNFERLVILLAWIGHLTQKLWPFEFTLRIYV